MPTIATAITRVAFTASLALAYIGTVAAAATAITPMAIESGRSGARCGAPTCVQGSAALRPRCRSAAKASATAARMTISIHPLAPSLVVMICSITPIVSATATATPKLAKRAIAAAASPRNSNSGPRASGVTTPTVGRMNMAATADTAPAKAHDHTIIVRGGTPLIDATSGLAAAPRMARPVFDNHKNTPSPSRRRGATIPCAA